MQQEKQNNYQQKHTGRYTPWKAENQSNAVMKPIPFIISKATAPVFKSPSQIGFSTANQGKICQVLLLDFFLQYFYKTVISLAAPSDL